MAGWKQHGHWERQNSERQALVEIPRVDLTKTSSIYNQMRQQQWSPSVQTVPDAFDFDGNKQLRSSENDYSNSSMMWSSVESNNYGKIGHWSSADTDRFVKIQQWMSTSARAVPDAVQFAHNSPKEQQPLSTEVYSRKVFIGGLPPDIDEEILLDVFSQIGPVTIDWPHKDQSTNRFPPQGMNT
uniref:RRM domain-containing protein n=1 Tax=Plectus sambesii TaxID=2011161 RepID=A0A914WD29_9BILA